MKTTIEISDALLEEVRAIAAREGVPMREVFERGLRLVVASPARHKPFKLRKASFKGHGLQPGMLGASWETIRDLVYEGHGGVPAPGDVAAPS